MTQSNIAAIVGFLAHHSGAIYPDARGYRAAMADLMARWRPAQVAA